MRLRLSILAIALVIAAPDAAKAESEIQPLQRVYRERTLPFVVLWDMRCESGASGSGGYEGDITFQMFGTPTAATLTSDTPRMPNGMTMTKMHHLRIREWDSPRGPIARNIGIGSGIHDGVNFVYHLDVDLRQKPRLGRVKNGKGRLTVRNLDTGCNYYGKIWINRDLPPPPY
jgi:hypothetical protein